MFNPAERMSMTAYATHKTNQFITQVLVYKMKYWNDWQYWNHQFIDTYGMLRSFYKNSNLAAFLVQSLLLKLIDVMQLSLVQPLQKYNVHVGHSRSGDPERYIWPQAKSMKFHKQRDLISSDFKTFWIFLNRTSIRKVMAGWNLQCSHLIFAYIFCEFSGLT